MLTTQEKAVNTTKVQPRVCCLQILLAVGIEVNEPAAIKQGGSTKVGWMGMPTKGCLKQTALAALQKLTTRQDLSTWAPLCGASKA